MRQKSSLLISVVCGLVMLTQAASAASPVGSVASSESVRISGTATKAQGIPSWPVLIGDVIEAGSAPAVIMLKGRELFTLQPGARASIESGGSGQPALRLLEGAMDYVLPESSRAQVYAGAQALSKPAGRVSLADEDTPSDVPSQARGPMPTNAPAGLSPRSPHSPCAADKSASPPRSPCSNGRN